MYYIVFTESYLSAKTTVHSQHFNNFSQYMCKLPAYLLPENH